MEYTILVDDWKQYDLNEDGTPNKDQKYYVHIPFECDPEEDTLIEFVDTQDYINDHKDDFDLLNNGESNGKECIISADSQPICDIKVEIKTVNDAGGRVIYDKKGNPEYLPPEQPDLSALTSMFSTLGDINIQTDVIDASIEKKEKISLQD